MNARKRRRSILAADAFFFTCTLTYILNIRNRGMHRMGAVDKWASKHQEDTVLDAELLLTVIEDVFEMQREKFFGSGKKSRIIMAKEVCILLGRESGASITELSKILGLDSSTTSRRYDSARERAQRDPQLRNEKELARQKYRSRIAESQV